MFVAWSVECHLCKTPDSIDHVFVGCWDVVFFCDVLRKSQERFAYNAVHHTFCFCPEGRGRPIRFTYCFRIVESVEVAH